MTEHIQAMNIYNHPVALNYAPEPDFIHGDFSYALNSVDVMSWNNYVFAVERFETDFETTQTYHSLPFLNKPLIHSEFGAFGQVGDCDNGSEFKKILCITPFIGAACSMNWHWQYPGETQLWPHIGIVQEFMSGIKLDEENWQVGEPQVTPDKAVEMYYLRNFVAGSYRACGVISNRTYNFYTQGPVGSFCKTASQEIITHPEYVSPTDFIWSDFGNSFLLDQMGAWNNYQVTWFNALTGAWLGSDTLTSNLFGSLLLLMPPDVVLTGTFLQPIVFFELYPVGETFKSAIQDSSGNEKETIQNMSSDSAVQMTVMTNWQTSNLESNSKSESFITVSPNPTDGDVSILCNFIDDSEKTWILTDVNGNILNRGYLNSPMIKLDLALYSVGIYYFTLDGITEQQTVKIVRQ